MTIFGDWITGSRAVAIVGICKNAGKTTLLNSIIASYPAHRWGVMSTGIDGEDTDAVYNHRKPKLKLPCGTVFICDTATVNGLKSSIAMLGKLPFGGKRKLWIARAMEDIETTITGPSSVKDQTRCAEMLVRYGVKTLLIDGSFDRKSIAQSNAVDSVILAVGAAFGTMDEIVNELHRIFELTRIPVADLGTICRRQLQDDGMVKLMRKDRWRNTRIESLFGKEQEIGELARNIENLEKIYIPGAITDTNLDSLLSLAEVIGESIVIRHPESLKLSLSNLKKLRKAIGIETLFSLEIKGISINSWAPGNEIKDSVEFRSTLRATFPEWDFVDVMEFD